jgi:formylglycine-generating enzyme required for sulfatase activity
MHAELRPVSDFNKQLPLGLDGVVKKALARDADARYRTCRELLDDLKKYSLAKGKADTVKESHGKIQETQLLGVPEMAVALAPAKNRKPLFALLAVLIAVLGVIIGTIWLSGRKTFEPVSGGDFSAGPPVAAGSTITGEEKNAALSPKIEPKNSSAQHQIQSTAVNKIPKTDAAQIPVEISAAEPVHVATPSTLNKKGFAEQTFFNRTVMVHIPVGNFTIGSPSGEGNGDEHPAHKVFINDFWLGKYEVTFEQFDFFCRETRRNLPFDEGWGRGNRPVVNVSWEDARSYCQWLSQKTGQKIRLPSEAEWEKAAREKYPWGSSAPTVDKVNMNDRGDGFPFTAPVGSFPLGESHYGVMDMAGNVWEWIADWYDAQYYKVSVGLDPRGPADGSNRVVRGGSWKNGAELIRSANRSSERPNRRLNIVGFRVAMDHR